MDLEWLPTWPDFNAGIGAKGTGRLPDECRSDDPAEDTGGQDTPGPGAAPDAPGSGESSEERRSERRRETEVTGRLRLPASEHDCRIVSLSAGGMTVLAADAVVTVGEQVGVVTQELPHLLGIVRWSRGTTFGVQFARPLTEDVIDHMAKFRRRVRTPRAGRAKVELPGLVYFDGSRHEVIVGNISVGGLMFTTRNLVKRGQRKLIRDGQALMIEFDELLPIGGHVRWTCGSTCGVMFSKLLSLPMAEEIVRLGNLSTAWLDDVRLSHCDYEERASKS